MSLASLLASILENQAAKGRLDSTLADNSLGSDFAGLGELKANQVLRLLTLEDRINVIDGAALGSVAGRLDAFRLAITQEGDLTAAGLLELQRAYAAKARVAVNYPVALVDADSFILQAAGYTSEGSVESSVADALATYHESLAAATTDVQRLQALSELVVSLSVEQPFLSGNDEILRVVVQRELVRNGLSPVVLDDVHNFAQLDVVSGTAAAQVQAILVRGMENAQDLAVTAGGVAVDELKLALVEQSLTDLAGGTNLDNAKLVLTEFSLDVADYLDLGELSEASAKTLTDLYEAAYPGATERPSETFKLLFADTHIDTYNRARLNELQTVANEMEAAADNAGLTEVSTALQESGLAAAIAGDELVSGTDVERFRLLLEQLGEGAQARNSDFATHLGTEAQSFFGSSLSDVSVPADQVQLFDQLANGFLSETERLTRTGKQDDIEFALRELAASEQSREAKVARLNTVFDAISDGTLPVGPFAEAVIDTIGLTATRSGSTTIDTTTFSLRGYLQEATGSLDLATLGSQIMDPVLRQRFGEEVSALPGGNGVDHLGHIVIGVNGDPQLTIILTTKDAQGRLINNRRVTSEIFDELVRLQKTDIGRNFLSDLVSVAKVLNGSNPAHATDDLSDLQSLLPGVDISSLKAQGVATALPVTLLVEPGSEGNSVFEVQSFVAEGESQGGTSSVIKWRLPADGSLQFSSADFLQALYGAQQRLQGSYLGDTEAFIASAKRLSSGVEVVNQLNALRDSLFFLVKFTADDPLLDEGWRREFRKLDFSSEQLTTAIQEAYQTGDSATFNRLTDSADSLSFLVERLTESAAVRGSSFKGDVLSDSKLKGLLDHSAVLKPGQLELYNVLTEGLPFSDMELVTVGLAFNESRWRFRSGRVADIVDALKYLEIAETGTTTSVFASERLSRVFTGITNGDFPAGPYAEAVLELVGSEAQPTLFAKALKNKLIVAAGGDENFLAFVSAIQDGDLRQRFIQQVAQGEPPEPVLSNARGEPVESTAPITFYAQTEFGDSALYQRGEYSFQLIGDDPEGFFAATSADTIALPLDPSPEAIAAIRSQLLEHPELFNGTVMVLGHGGRYQARGEFIGEVLRGLPVKDVILASCAACEPRVAEFTKAFYQAYTDGGWYPPSADPIQIWGTPGALVSRETFSTGTELYVKGYKRVSFKDFLANPRQFLADPEYGYIKAPIIADLAEDPGQFPAEPGDFTSG